MAAKRFNLMALLLWAASLTVGCGGGSASPGATVDGGNAGIDNGGGGTDTGNTGDGNGSTDGTIDGTTDGGTNGNTDSGGQLIKPDPRPLKLELLAGTISSDFANCTQVDGDAATARFGNLLRAAIYSDGLYLADTGEGCNDKQYYAPPFLPNTHVGARIRKLTANQVETVLYLGSYITALSHPLMVKYPSGIYRKPDSGETFVLGYVAADGYRDFWLDASEVAEYTEQGGWDYYVPGLFRIKENYATYHNLVAGSANQAPVYVDGYGFPNGCPSGHRISGPTPAADQPASFVTPHDLEVDSTGLMYLIDDGRIRTVDQDFNVKTLDPRAVGITERVTALDADHQGNIHVLTQGGIASFTWHQLSDGSRVDFSTLDRFVTTEPPGRATFTVAGNDIVLAVRDMAHSGRHTELFRVTPTGRVTRLNGKNFPASPQDVLDDPAKYLLPPVMHIQYGIDGHLYLVLQQGVLRVKDFS